MADPDPNAPAQRRAASLSLAGVMWASIRHSWRVSIAVSFGVATATAVIVGALLVGDSMRGSLRALTIERLGEVQSAVIPGRFFDFEGIAGDSVADPQRVVRPIIFFPSGAVEARGAGDEAAGGTAGAAVRRAGSVQILGIDDSFWELGLAGVRPQKLPDDDGVVLNEATASELGVSVGDQVTLRLPVDQAVPADSPLGRREIQSEGLPRMGVCDIVPDRGLGRFAITPNQASPQNVFVAREVIAELLERDGQVNALLLTEELSTDQLNIELADLGLQLERVRREFTPDGGDPETIYDYYSLTSDRLLLPEPVVQRVTRALPGGSVTPVMTYLANAIERLDDSGAVVASVPYSTITATQSHPSLPLDFSRPAGGDAGDGDGADDRSQRRVPLVINSWTAEQLDADVGTPLRVAYFEPEVEKGQEVERHFDAIVTDVVPVTEPATPYGRRREATFDRRPTVYNDPALTPTVPGVTDQESISDWDLPFRLTREIDRVDDRYWNEHRLTPKAFLPLEDGRRLFGSRFGQTTSLKIRSDVAESQAALASQIRSAVDPVLDGLGWAVQPIRRQQLSASSGTTPFDALFLALSFFVILAAVMLIAMLFRLGLVERLKQFGTLMALGWTPRRVATLALGEGLLIAIAGAALGLIGGIAYAKFVLWALKTWWVGAITVPFLNYHWTALSLVLGVGIGWIVAAATLGFAVRSLLKLDAQTLLSGRETDAQATRIAHRASRHRTRGTDLSAIAAAVAAVAIAAVGASMSGQAAAGGFVGGGMLLLVAAILAIHGRLRKPRRIEVNMQPRSETRYSLPVLSARNASRNPMRSTLSIGLMATAAFLIIAITAFRLQPTQRGTGGFELIAKSAQPLFRDLSDPDVQAGLLGPDADSLERATLATLRMRPGQDASCNNLYQATEPTVLGVPASFADRYAGQESPRTGFEWAASAEVPAGETPWRLLASEATGTREDPVPVVIDQNTAMWSLQMRGGVGEVRSFEYEAGNPVFFEVVGLLKNSVLQGQLLIGEANFQRLFPHLSGYQFFLVDCPDEQQAEVAAALESRLGDIGMDVSDASDVLAGLLAVQNTYLRTFQSLGALGLLLGTIGLAVTQLRSVLERRQELAVMRAIGYTRRRLAAVVLGETASLLLAGIGCGAVCAILAVLPYAYLSQLKPPVVEPLLVVLGILIFGMLAGLIAVWRVVTMPLLDSLRAK